MITENCVACGTILVAEWVSRNQGFLKVAEDSSLQARQVSPGGLGTRGTAGLQAAWNTMGQVHPPDCFWIREALTLDQAAALWERLRWDFILPP